MESSLSATATTAGKLFAGSTFVVPQYQREYAWTKDEVGDFWSDLQQSLNLPEYFLGLIILTEEDDKRHVVDGQQRLLTLTLLAAGLHHEANRHGRKALAERLYSTFLTSIDYATDEEVPRLVLADAEDEATLREIVRSGRAPQGTLSDEHEGISDKIVDAYAELMRLLRDDLAADPFKRLGRWAEFLIDRLFMAAFVHPDSASAYRVFEIVNTRGRDLTTADLLKNYVISQAKPAERESRYRAWKGIARPLRQAGNNVLVQFIRHVVTLQAGHMPPRDLFDYIANRAPSTSERKVPPTVTELMDSLDDALPLYMQMIDPTLEGPASESWLPVFEALNDLGVISVRPLMLAISKSSDADAGMDELFELVVRRIVVGNLGTGNVERRFGDGAREIHRTGVWRPVLEGLSDLSPDIDNFKDRVTERSFNKSILTFLRRSEIQGTTKPERVGVIHSIRPRQAVEWEGFPQEDFTYWGSTLGNAVLSTYERRPNGASTWSGFRTNLLPECLDQDVAALNDHDAWQTSDVQDRGRKIADALAAIWYGDDK